MRLASDFILTLVSAKEYKVGNKSPNSACPWPEYSEDVSIFVFVYLPGSSISLTDLVHLFSSFPDYFDKDFEKQSTNKAQATVQL